MKCCHKWCQNEAAFDGGPCPRCEKLEQDAHEQQAAMEWKSEYEDEEE